MLDTDERAILFLCCGNHVVTCDVCQRERPMQTLRRRASDPDRWLCPRCRHDMSERVLQHARACRYFIDRKPLDRIAPLEPPAAASA